MTAHTDRIGWIGTGRMGHAMATRLLLAGHAVHVWNRTKAKADDLGTLGATVVETVAELANRDVVFTMVAADDDLLEVTVGPGGVLTQSVAPSYLIDSSTVSAETSAILRRAAVERGTKLLACPVSGNAKVVKAGKLSLAVSGDKESFEAVRNLLTDLGQSVTYVGDGEVARLVKLAHNIFLGVVIQSLAEITILAERGGVARADFLEFMNGSVLGSVFTRYKTPALVNLDMTPTFTTKLLRKDFDLGLAAARELQVAVPIAAATQQLVQAAIGRGHGDSDFAALLLEQARNSGFELEPENTEVADGLAPLEPRSRTPVD